MIRSAKRLVRKVGLALAERPHIRSFYGPDILRRSGDKTYNFCRTGEYGTFLSDLLERQSSDFVFLDIGANIGIYSLIAARNPHCRRVFAFEPIPSTFKYLVGNIELNAAVNVVPICGALTATAEPPILPMSFSASHSGVSQIVDRGSEASIYAIALTAAHLDELLSGIDRLPLFVKIDVEGAELSVLQALRSSAKFGQVEQMVVEVSSADHVGADQPERITTALIRDGFTEKSRYQHPGWAHYDALFVR